MILPEHGGESVFQQDYLRGMQYNVYAKALFAPFGNQNHTLHTCGNGCVARAETLIPGGFAGLFGENGVVFLSRVRWISFRR